jgi:hypothetical protein
MRVLWKSEQYGIITECHKRAVERVLPASRYRLWGLLFRRSFFGMLQAMAENDRGKDHGGGRGGGVDSA